MTVTIWHNPRCSKSRTTLKLLEDAGVQPNIRLYLTDAPTEKDIRIALELLGIPAIELVRRGEAEFKTAGLSRTSSEDELITAMAAFPKLIERPIVFANGKAAIGRPPESALAIL